MKINHVIITLICFVFIFGCNSNDGILFVQKEKNKKIYYPESINIAYKGYKVGKAELIDSNGTYKLQNKRNEVCFFENSNFYIQKTNFIGLSYQIIVDTVQVNNTNCSNIADTFYYSFYEQNINDQRINNAINSLRKVLDTLREFAPIDSVSYDTNNNR